MKKYKVKITRENFDSFVEYYNKDKKHVDEMMKLLVKETNMYKSPIYENAKKMFGLDFMAYSSDKGIFSFNNKENLQLQKLIHYCADRDLLWNLEAETKHYLYLSFSGTYMFWDKKYCTLVEQPDYDGLSLGEIRGLLGSNSMSASLPAEMNAISINSINDEKEKVKSAERELKKLKEDISYARTAELAKMEEEIRKLQNTLYDRKKELMAELDEKMAAMNAQMKRLNTQIQILEAEIYSIRSYSGETLELRKVRNGRKSSIETPLVVNQKMIYLDEDLARIVSIYQTEIAKHYELFEDALKDCDAVFESFCPQERCLTFFRLSKNASYRYFNVEHRMYESEELIHGKKIGFILRDGECAYMGWMDESWRTNEDGAPVPVTFTENLMYQPKTDGAYNHVDDASRLHNDSRNEMISRVFAMSVVQGILDNKGLLEFPEKVQVTKAGRYIVYNFATAWLEDNRFGDFATLVDNLNKRTKVKDQILICYNKHFCSGRGERDRAHDCEVPEGINRVNFLESDAYGHSNIYVSAKKRWSYKGATANVIVSKNEYINITYMNSIWMSYYVQTKKLGSYAEDYAKMVKHFKRAIEILKEREAEEMSYIKKYYPEADQIPEWEIKLSHWKLNHHIRFINDFQAKRIALYLQEGYFEENKNLFEKEVFYNTESTNGNKYTKTNFGYVSKPWHTEDVSEVGEFEKNSPYYLQTYFIDGLYRYSWNEEEKEKNRIKIAEELPKLEATVPERLKQDEKKLILVNQYVKAFMDEHGVLASDIEEDISGLTFKNGNLDFVRLDTLEKEERNTILNLLSQSSTYPDYILKSECWKVAYYAFIHDQYDKLLHEVKMVIHKRFMNDTTKVIA